MSLNQDVHCQSGSDSDLGGGSLRREPVGCHRDMEARSENEEVVSWERAVVCLRYDNGF
jgi:hypothetical protein